MNCRRETINAAGSRRAARSVLPYGGLKSAIPLSARLPENALLLREARGSRRGRGTAPIPLGPTPPNGRSSCAMCRIVSLMVTPPATVSVSTRSMRGSSSIEAVERERSRTCVHVARSRRRTSRRGPPAGSARRSPRASRGMSSGRRRAASAESAACRGPAPPRPAPSIEHLRALRPRLVDVAGEPREVARVDDRGVVRGAQRIRIAGGDDPARSLDERVAAAPRARARSRARCRSDRRSSACRPGCARPPRRSGSPDRRSPATSRRARASPA